MGISKFLIKAGGQWRMAFWLAVILTVCALLFICKMAYVFCVAMVLPHTQGALYVSTSRKRIAAALASVSMKAGDRLVDLGCGDGRVLRMARKRVALHAVGYELNPLAYIKARILCAGRGGIAVHHRNFWNIDLSSADIVCCYLFPDVMPRLSAKLCRELKPGTWIISFNFPLPGISLHHKLRPDSNPANDPIYFYKKGITDCTP